MSCEPKLWPTLFCKHIQSYKDRCQTLRRMQETAQLHARRDRSRSHLFIWETSIASPALIADLRQVAHSSASKCLRGLRPVS